MPPQWELAARGGREIVIEGRRWLVFVDAGGDLGSARSIDATTTRSLVTYVFRAVEPRSGQASGQAADERRTRGYYASLDLASDAALIRLFRHAE